MNDKGVFAVLRYDNADAYVSACRALYTCEEARDIADARVVQDPEGVCIIVRVIAVVPGRLAHLNMKTEGEA